MNNRDPFNLHRTSPLQILQSGASVAAKSTTTFSAQVIASSKETLEAGKQVLNKAGVLNTEEMSFSLPNNVPSFNNPQRNFEDRSWGSGVAQGQRASFGGVRGVQGRIGGIFEQRELPMYKDKPYTYVASRRRKPLWRRKRTLVIGVLFMLMATFFLGFFSKQSAAPQQKDGSKSAWSWLKKPEPKNAVDWNDRRERVKDAFKLSWDAYERHAWGMLFTPLACNV